MKKAFMLLVVLVVVAVAGYLLLPSPAFPGVPPGALQSFEPADTESVYRRSYFTNLTREEIMAFYAQQFFVPGQFRLNHPPEEAYELVRDQTRSSFLEELVHPGREALFVNGFVPKKASEQINRNGVSYINKVTVRYVPSSRVTRLTVLGLGVIAGYLILKVQFHV